MPQRLTDLDIFEVSLVDRPANPLSKVALYKRDDSEILEKGDPSHDDVYIENVDMDYEEDSDKKKGKKKRMIAHGNTRKYDQDRKEVRSMSEETMNYTVTPEYVEELEEMVIELQDSLKKRDAELDRILAEDTEDDDDILKSLDPAAYEMIRKAEARASEAEAIAKAERDARVTREFIQKAETGMNFLPGSAEHKADLLKSVHNVDAALAARIEEMLRSANEQARLGKADMEIGDDADNGTSVEGELEKLAKGIQHESAGAMTYEEAYAEALERNPGLYTQLIQEG